MHTSILAYKLSSVYTIPAAPSYTILTYFLNFVKSFFKFRAELYLVPAATEEVYLILRR
jgi:hypothetical protein